MYVRHSPFVYNSAIEDAVNQGVANEIVNGRSESLRSNFSPFVYNPAMKDAGNKVVADALNFIKSAAFSHIFVQIARFSQDRTFE